MSDEIALLSDDDSISPTGYTSWSTPPVGFQLLIEDSGGNYYLLINDEGYTLLIE
jgi:hypothetical protein